MSPFVYILASESRELYVGVTNNLERRLAEHRAGLCRGYAFEHGITQLVHFEVTTNDLSFGSLASLGMTTRPDQR